MSKTPQVIPVRDPETQYLNKSGMPPIHEHLPQIDGFGGGACLLCISPVKIIYYLIKIFTTLKNDLILLILFQIQLRMMSHLVS